MPAARIMIIRHAEKPDPGKTLGVSPTGHEDPRSLSVRGWQRAGALVALFGPERLRRANPLLATPTAIFASRPTRTVTIRSRPRGASVGSGGADDGAAPIPGQQRGQLRDLVIGDAGEHIGEPGLRIDLIEPCRLNERQHEGGALAAAIGAGE